MCFSRMRTQRKILRERRKAGDTTWGRMQSLLLQRRRGAMRRGLLLHKEGLRREESSWKVLSQVRSLPTDR